MNVRTSLAALCLFAAPAFAQVSQPFDAATLDQALKGLRVYHARMTEIVAMRVQYLNAQNRRSQAGDKSQAEVDAYDNAKSKFDNCVSSKLNAQDPAKMAKMQEKVMAAMTNPANAQKYAELNQAMATAAGKGDTTAMKKATADLMKLIGMDPKADTVAAMSACAPAPRIPTAVAELKSLDHQVDSISVRLRKAENAVETEAAAAAGVTPTRFAQMRERLEMYVNKPSGFTGVEATILAAHKAEIATLTKQQ